ncbi:MAG: DUF3800 domain-containing protein [Candidatus Campbellbacteria bacterium]|nr:DUF3800 domain-containing protein [Candidatus Campbellbacteria bacterium]
MNKTFFFIDDSGSLIWDNPYSKEFLKNPPNRSEQNLNYWRRNYFVFAGIHISAEKLKELNPLINTKKEEYFGTKNVEIKSEWLRVPKKRHKHYLLKYGITEEKLREFVDKFWYSLFSSKNFIAQAFVLDKRYYAKRDTQPIALLTQVIFDRLGIYPVEDIIVVFDQMESDIKSKKGKHGIIIDVSKQKINTSPFFVRYSHSEVRFEKSFNSNFLQIADTVAYNVFRQFVSNGDQWESDKKELEVYEYLEKIEDCLYTNKKGVINGFGIIKVPDPAHKKWGQQKKTSKK